MSLSELFIPFPNQLMSTARAADKMPLTFARELQNMYTGLDGAGSKRNGVVPQGEALPLAEGDAVIRLFSYLSATGVFQLLAQTASGKLYVQTADAWTEIDIVLTPNSPLRSAQQAGKLIFCNGVDDVLVWDGNAIAAVQQSIPELGANLAYHTVHSFKVASEPRFYAAGTPVTATLASGEVTTTSLGAETQPDGTILVTLADDVLDNTLSAIAFTLKPPKFNYVYATHDRLWGFGEGAIAADNYGTAAERARVYYTEGLNDPTAWYSAEGTLQHINLGDKMPAQDMLQAMAVKDGYTIFFCKTQTQMWVGSDPTATGNMSWYKTLPIGVVHGNLVVNLPNDVGFFTSHGARTLSRLLQTEELDVGDVGREISPTLSADVSAIFRSAALYNRVQPFAYPAQDWFGFHLNNNGRVFQMTPTGVGWTTFSGIFSEATAFCTAVNGKLYLAKGAQVYVYAEDVYADDGDAIETLWWTPWLNAGSGSKRWANKGLTPVIEQGYANILTLKRFKNYDSSSFVVRDVSTTPTASYWDSANWDAAYFDNSSPTQPRVRDNFVADVFAYKLATNNTQGPLTVFGLKVDGIREN